MVPVNRNAQIFSVPKDQRDPFVVVGQANVAWKTHGGVGHCCDDGRVRT